MKIEKRCLNCNKEFKVYPCRKDKAKFCCVSCSMKYNWKQEEYKNKQKEVHKGYIMPKSQKEKIGQSLKGKKKPHRTLQHRINMSKSRIKEGGSIDNEGYRRITVSLKNRMKKSHYIWFRDNDWGMWFIPKGWVIHHLNGKKLDDRIENLVCLPTEIHSRLHALKRKIIC